MGIHIIHCKNDDEYKSFLSNGYAAVGAISPKERTRRKLAAKIATNWDIISDLKRVKPGDFMFFHADKKIYGLFETTTYFMANPNMPEEYQSENLNIDYWESVKNFSEPGYCWKVGIKSIGDKTFSEGFNFEEIFKLKSLCKVRSIPERFLYIDKPKVVSPLLSDEFDIVFEKLLEINRQPSYIHVTPNKLSDYRNINLDLKSYHNELSFEKILEAYLMENITYNGDNLDQYNNLKKCIGDYKEFANVVFTYYTNFIDIFCYSTKSPDIPQFKVIELKKGTMSNDAIIQVKKYMDWIIKVYASGNENDVAGMIIARRIPNEYKNHANPWAKENITFCEYDFVQSHSSLTIKPISVAKPSSIQNMLNI